MKWITVLLFALTHAAAFAQTGTGKLRYNGVDYPCYIKTYQVSAEVVERSVEKMMEEKGYKNTGRRNLMVYRGVNLEHVNGGQPADVVVRVDESKKKGETQSTLYLTTVHAGKLHSDKDERNAAKAAAAGLGLTHLAEGFHDNLDMLVTQTHFEAELAAMEAEIKKLEKKLSNLDDDKASMLKRIEKLQQDVKDADAEMETTKTKIAEQKEALEKKKAAAPGKIS